MQELCLIDSMKSMYVHSDLECHDSKACSAAGHGPAKEMHRALKLMLKPNPTRHV